MNIGCGTMHYVINQGDTYPWPSFLGKSYSKFLRCIHTRFQNRNWWNLINKIKLKNILDSQNIFALINKFLNNPCKRQKYIVLLITIVKKVKLEIGHVRLHIHHYRQTKLLHYHKLTHQLRSIAKLFSRRRCH